MGAFVRSIARNLFWVLKNMTQLYLLSQSSLIFIIKTKYENHQRSKSNNQEQDFPGSQAKPFEEDGDREAADPCKTKCLDARLLGTDTDEGRG